MKYRKLGNTDLVVSEIGIGCEGFAEDGYRMAVKLLDRAEELGINYFDLYASDPESRRAVGEALQGRRDKFMLQGHICAAWKDGQYLRTRELPEVQRAFEDLFAALKTDYIDVGMIHFCDAEKDWDRIVQNGILDYAKKLKQEGRIRHIGLSSHNPLAALKAIETGEIEVLMFSVNPCYDLQPASEDPDPMWSDSSYEKELTNMDPDRQRLYETCQREGVGITVMKAFAGGELLTENKIAGVSLTVNQCIAYALSRPAVATVLAGALTVEELEKSAAYSDAPEEEKDYAGALASFPRVSWIGQCLYCSHCAPCVSEIGIADVTRYLNLTGDGAQIPETVREHYRALPHHAGECIGCGACEPRCPFGVSIRENMRRAAEIFGY